MLYKHLRKDKLKGALSQMKLVCGWCKEYKVMAVRVCGSVHYSVRRMQSEVVRAEMKENAERAAQ